MGFNLTETVVSVILLPMLELCAILEACYASIDHDIDPHPTEHRDYGHKYDRTQRCQQRQLEDHISYYLKYQPFQQSTIKDNALSPYRSSNAKFPAWPPQAEQVGSSNQ